MYYPNGKEMDQMVHNDVACNCIPLERIAFCYKRIYSFNCFLDDFNCVFMQILCLSVLLWSCLVANITYLYSLYMHVATESMGLIKWLTLFLSHSKIRSGAYHRDKWAAPYDFQQCGISTSVNSYESVQPPFKLRNSKCCYSHIIFKPLTKALIRLRRLIWAFVGCIYHIVWNLLLKLKWFRSRSWWGLTFSDQDQCSFDSNLGLN